MPSSVNRFNEKGAAAEELIAGLCKDAFFQDFCFKNPYYLKGKELCDVLVVLNDIAIIWQIKNLKLGTNGHFREAEISKAVKQCRGAKRKLKTLNSVELVNIVGQKKVIDTSKITEYFLIAAIEGGGEEFGQYYDEDSKKGNVHIFSDNFTRFATKHLDTVSDFMTYLRDKEEFIDGKGVIIGGGEEDLLALYLKAGRTFGNVAESKPNHVFFDVDGAAKDLEDDEDYKAKISADRISKTWDLLIQKKREGLPQEGQIDNPEARDKFLAKMMSHNRFERRYLGQMFFEAAETAANGPRDDTFAYRRYFAADGVTYVFAFMGSIDADRSLRRKMLYVAALAARSKISRNNMVIAVVTEREMAKSRECGFDWVLLDLTDKELEEELTPQVKEVIQKSGFLKAPAVQMVSAYEYPSDVPKKV